MYFESKLHMIPTSNEQDAPRLLVVMAPMNFKGRYMQYKSFLKNQICDLLFITDNSDTYYMGNDNGEGVRNMLYMRLHDFYLESEITFLGSSMSAYAALRFGLEFNANIIMSNPQLDRAATLASVKNDRKNKMPGKIPKNLIPVDKFFSGSSKQSTIWYSCGHYKMDTANLCAFTACKPRSTRAIIERINTIDHKYFFEDVKRVYEVMNVLKAIRSVCSPDTAGYRVV